MKLTGLYSYCAKCHAVYERSSPPYCAADGTQLTPEDNLVLGKYILKYLLGRGGSGEVWFAHELLLDRPVALKIITNSSFVQKEGAVLAKLQHEHVVQVYEAGTWQDQFYLAMEPLAGPSISVLLEGNSNSGYSSEENSRPFGMPAAMQVWTQVISGISYVHQNDIIHRDIKPDNVVFLKKQEPRSSASKSFDGPVKLIDFGIAKANFGGSQSMVVKNLGTYFYAPKEQRQGQATKRSDVYALGKLMLAMLKGTKSNEDPAPDILDQPLQNLPADVLGTLSPALRELLCACVAIDPAARPADATALQVRLRETPEYLALFPTSTQSVPSAPSTPAQQPQPPSWQKRAIASRGWIGALLLATLGCGLLIIWSMGPLRRPSSHPPKTLAACVGKAQQLLSLSLQATDGATHRLAVQALAMSEDPEARPQLEALLQSRFAESAATAATALGRMGHPESVSPLHRQLSATSTVLQSASAAALTKICRSLGEPKLQAFLRGSEASERTQAAWALAECDGCEKEEAWALLWQSLGDRAVLSESGIAQMGRLALAGAEGAREQLTDVFERTKGTAQSRLHVHSAGWLAQLYDAAAKEDLLKTLRVSHGAERQVAAQYLACINREEGRQVLIENLDREADEERRIADLDCLGRFPMLQKGHEAEASLAGVLDRWLSDPAMSLRTRLAAAGLVLRWRALGADARPESDQIATTFGGEFVDCQIEGLREQTLRPSTVAVQRLGTAMRAAQPMVRLAAARLLAAHPTAQSAQILAASLRDTDASVRAESAKSLTQIVVANPQNTGTLLDAGARETLRQVGRGTTDTEALVARGLLSSVGDAASVSSGASSWQAATQVKDERVRALLYMSGRVDVPTLRKGLHDSSRSVQLAAATQLAANKSKDVSKEGLDTLRTLVRAGGRESLIAFQVLRRLGVEEVPTPDLLSLVRGADPDLRLMALGVVQELSDKDALAALRIGSLHADPLVRQRSAEVAATIFKRSRQESFRQIVEWLRVDTNRQVQLRAAMLLPTLAEVTPVARRPELEQRLPRFSPAPNVSKAGALRDPAVHETSASARPNTEAAERIQRIEKELASNPTERQYDALASQLSALERLDLRKVAPAQVAKVHCLRGRIELLRRYYELAEKQIQQCLKLARSPANSERRVMTEAEAVLAAIDSKKGTVEKYETRNGRCERTDTLRRFPGALSVFSAEGARRNVSVETGKIVRAFFCQPDGSKP